MRRIMLLGLALMLAGCAGLQGESPPHPSRYGRFLGLAVQCNCAGLTYAQLAERLPTLACPGHTPRDVDDLRGYAYVGAREPIEAELSFCRGVCANSGLVQAMRENRPPTEQACRRLAIPAGVGLDVGVGLGF